MFFKKNIPIEIRRETVLNLKTFPKQPVDNYKIQVQFVAAVGKYILLHHLLRLAEYKRLKRKFYI